MAYTSSLSAHGPACAVSLGPAGQRITVRLMAYWEKLRKGRPMPPEHEFNHHDIADLWDYCFLVQPRDAAAGDYHYRYLGPAIVHAYAGELHMAETGGLLSLHADKLALNYAKILATGQPLLEEGEFRNCRNDLVKYRQCLLPLGEGGQVACIFGGMRFKIFHAV